MGVERAPVHHSVSTWRQPLLPPVSARRSAITERVAARVASRGGVRLRVAIDGLTAAGKTSFGHELAERISAAGRPVLRASLDDFSGEGYYRNAFDYAAAKALLLEPSAPHGSGRCALCSIDPLTQRDHSAVTVQAPSDAVLIVDGVFAFRPEINEHWDLRIWLDVDPELAGRRGIARDEAMEGAEAEALHRDRYVPAERLYMAEVDPVGLAQVVIDNTAFGRPRIVRLR
ncbi:uridine kinase [Actinomadura sp. BRA 177]|uniref:uridine kinase n=1 Tax=Actinomadura sp. BRA 177 TaxID=2745202 RepID=UPI0015952785|nr:uridine kinase [Actinomadura sp. BRA 177]NVI92293.1 uridine kinase [Actinomadura sp. BRA 177]